MTRGITEILYSDPSPKKCFEAIGPFDKGIESVLRKTIAIYEEFQGCRVRVVTGQSDVTGYLPLPYWKELGWWTVPVTMAPMAQATDIEIKQSAGISTVCSVAGVKSITKRPLADLIEMVLCGPQRQRWLYVGDDLIEEGEAKGLIERRLIWSDYEGEMIYVGMAGDEHWDGLEETSLEWTERTWDDCW